VDQSRTRVAETGLPASSCSAKRPSRPPPFGVGCSRGREPRPQKNPRNRFGLVGNHERGDSEHGPTRHQTPIVEGRESARALDQKQILRDGGRRCRWRAMTASAQGRGFSVAKTRVSPRGQQSRSSLTNWPKCLQTFYAAEVTGWLLQRAFRPLISRPSKWSSVISDASIHSCAMRPGGDLTLR